ncbi:PKD-like family lipoprotein [Arcticibacter tournemirensis]|uniref:PKD-like family protein n=1 Tax=Arcticibacter tournemirensis TaxID=699437 RepID=A0A4Q0MGT6_9SPHI|nr:PKD-like family lipoprotein [Arcticibacter tournemirensis]RXF72209.1 hypothetical protein EKH83_00345 [Arcticibacter tournemirensis]
MKSKYIYLLAFVALFYTSCKKDLGNYDYSPPSEPVIEGIRNANIPALIGDSLIIKPKVSLAGADPLKDLSFEWRILLLEELRELSFTGYPFKMLFNLGTGERAAKLIVTDKRNGLIYKYEFKITGTTQFSTGTVILSNEGGKGKLSFVKSDNTVLANIYETLQPGLVLPDNPVQLYYSKPLPYQLLSKEEYWIMCNDASSGSVIVNPSTLFFKDNFRSQFFLPPSTVTPGYLETLMGTISNGVINGKLYVGIQSTAPFAPDYGKYANAQPGDYNLSPMFTKGGSFYLGFDTKTKAFVVFDGGGSYLGTNYGTGTATTLPFNPKDIGMSNLLYFKASESGTTYAFFRDETGTWEYSFNNKLNEGTKEIVPEQKRKFAGSSLVLADSKWVRNTLNVFYFSSADKIYRYNPINEEVRALDANFGGKKVSMIKISADDNTLTVGVEGALYSLDVTVGKNGNIVESKTINGIPGSPVDVLIRTN